MRFHPQTRLGVPTIACLSLLISQPCLAHGGDEWPQGAGGPAAQRLFDGSTRAAWTRTWHGPNALATPICPYDIPRCCNDGCPAGLYGPARCADGIIGSVDASTAVACPITVEPSQFERLGYIPNELGLGNVLPAASPAR